MRKVTHWNKGGLPLCGNADNDGFMLIMDVAEVDCPDCLVILSRTGAPTLADCAKAFFERRINEVAHFWLIRRPYPFGSRTQGEEE